MNKNKITSYFVFLSFLTLVTIFFSIVEKSYFNLKKPQKLVENNALLKEFNPNLDLSIISTIESKDKNTEDSFDFSIIRFTDTEDTINPNIEPEIKPSITPILEPTSSSSAEVSTL